MKMFPEADHSITFPLPTAVRGRAEQFFGYDFGEVRIHPDSTVPAALGCLAFACGKDIYLKPGFYSPATTWGCKILLHELTHVVQQAEGRAAGGVLRDIVFLHDAVLESEADKAAELAWLRTPSADTILRMLPDTQNKVVQPIVEIMGVPYKKSGANTFSTLWQQVSTDHYLIGLHLSKSATEKLKTKLRHWVDAPKAAALFGKGHRKEFSGIESLIRSLHGRITDRDSKALEGKLAKKISGSRYIKTSIRDFISTYLVTMDTFLRQNDGLRDELDAVDIQDKGRYAYFYSSGPGAISKKNQRSLAQALTYMNSGRRSISEMCSFLCDYAMVARAVISEKAIPVIIPNEDARSTHFNVNEQSDWVKRARTAHVRLGAGPSATTMNVLRMCKAVLDDSEASSRTMLCVALGLFSFWNLKKGNLQTKSEIHTYHEVMLVAHGYGLPTVPALTDRNIVMTEFEYPQEADIPA